MNAIFACSNALGDIYQNFFPYIYICLRTSGYGWAEVEKSLRKFTVENNKRTKRLSSRCHYCMRIWRIARKTSLSLDDQEIRKYRTAIELSAHEKLSKYIKFSDRILINRKNIVSAKVLWHSFPICIGNFALPKNSEFAREKEIRLQRKLENSRFERQKIFAFFQNVIERSCNSLSPIGCTFFTFHVHQVERSQAQETGSRQFQVCVSSLMIFNWKKLYVSDPYWASKNYRKVSAQGWAREKSV